VQTNEQQPNNAVITYFNNNRYFTKADNDNKLDIYCT